MFLTLCEGPLVKCNLVDLGISYERTSLVTSTLIFLHYMDLSIIHKCEPNKYSTYLFVSITWKRVMTQKTGLIYIKKSWTGNLFQVAGPLSKGIHLIGGFPSQSPVKWSFKVFSMSACMIEALRMLLKYMNLKSRIKYGFNIDATYRKTSDIRCTLARNKIVDHSDHSSLN